MAYYRRKGTSTYVVWFDGKRWVERSTGTTDPRVVGVALQRAREAERAARRAVEPSPARRPLDVLSDFLSDRERRNCREGTLRFYRGNLAPLFRDWAERPWEEWTRAALESWVDGRRAARRALGRRVGGAAALGSLVRAIRALLGWARSSGAIVPDFLAGLTPPHVDREEPVPLDDGALPRLVRAAPTAPLRIVVALAGYAGLRRSEILRLDWADVDLVAGTVRVTRKARSILRLDLHPTLQSVLTQEWAGLQVRGEQVAGPVARLTLCDRDTTAGLRATYAAAGVPYPSGRPLHVLRHSLTSQLLSRGVAAHVVRDVMGHASLETTTRYAHSRAEQRRAALTAQ